MYARILVPVVFDHEPNVARALSVARELLARAGEITLLHVVEDIPGHVAAQLPAGLLAENRADAVKRLDALAQKYGPGVRVALVDGHASRSILEHARENAVDCIVIVSHRPGLQDYLIGSTAARVVRHAHCSVHVIR